MDHQKQKGVSPDWIFNHVRADKKTVIDEVVRSGFAFADEVELTELQYLIRFKKKSGRAAL